MSRLLAFALVVFLSGCAVIGPTSIETGRGSYNEALETTARQQTLMNIVRVHENQTPIFMDVPEIDAAVQFQASSTGAITNIGARPGASGGTLAGQVGSAGAGLNYEESPTVRYQPVQGQALFAQISSPITVDTLAALFGSDWPTSSILAFAADQWAPSFKDNAAALNMILWLDGCGALAVAATRSDFSASGDGQSGQLVKPPGTSITIQTQPPASGGNDALDFYFVPKRTSCDSALQKRVWNNLWSLYSGTQPDSDGNIWKYKDGIPLRLELRTTPIKDSKKSGINILSDNLAPVLRTHSALGILKSIDTFPRQIQYVSAQEYERIVDEPYNKINCQDFYTMSPTLARDILLEDEKSEINKWSTVTIKILDDLLRAEHNDDNCLYMVHAPASTPAQRDQEMALNHLRRYILIVMSNNSPPADTYVSWRDEKGVWYYIVGNDGISQRNFMLVAQFMTIQSTVTPNPSLTAVSVGPH